MTFALNLKRLRLERGLTQTALAALCGIAQPNLAAMEQSRRQPTLATLQRIADSLDVDPGIFLQTPGSGLDRFTMDETCRSLVYGKNRPKKLDEKLWRDLQVTFQFKLQAMHPEVIRPKLRISSRAAQSRLKARLGRNGFEEITARLGKIYP